MLLLDNYMFLHFHGNTEHICTVDSYIYTNSKKDVYFYLCMTTMENK